MSGIIKGSDRCKICYKKMHSSRCFIFKSIRIIICNPPSDWFICKPQSVVGNQTFTLRWESRGREARDGRKWYGLVLFHFIWNFWSWTELGILELHLTTSYASGKPNCWLIWSRELLSCFMLKLSSTTNRIISINWRELLQLSRPYQRWRFPHFRSGCLLASIVLKQSQLRSYVTQSSIKARA